MKAVAVLFPLALLAGVFVWQPSFSADAPAIPAYPEGYRGWSHVKSTMIGPAHQNFEKMGGYQHIYANTEGVAGYRTREFPEGSVLVVDWLTLQEKDGLFAEGPRRQVDVMVKDSQRFASTGGWGFQRYVGDSKTELSTTLRPQQCFACHEKLKKDGLVLSRYRQ